MLLARSFLTQAFPDGGFGCCAPSSVQSAVGNDDIILYSAQKQSRVPMIQFDAMTAPNLCSKQFVEEASHARRMPTSFRESAKSEDDIEIENAVEPDARVEPIPRMQTPPVNLLTSETRQYPDGAVYTGHFQDGKKHGAGKLVSPEWTYDGQWEHGKKHGYGLGTWSDGRSYVGEWRHGLFEGKGKMTWITDQGPHQYIGDYLANQKHGHGTFVFADGRVFEGGWQEGRREGKGVQVDHCKTSAARERTQSGRLSIWRGSENTSVWSDELIDLPNMRVMVQTSI